MEKDLHELLLRTGLLKEQKKVIENLENYPIRLMTDAIILEQIFWEILWWICRKDNKIFECRLCNENIVDIRFE